MVELGCGQGGLISRLALQNPQFNFLAIDLIDDMLGLTKRAVEQAYGRRGAKSTTSCSPSRTSSGLPESSGSGTKSNGCTSTSATPGPRPGTKAAG